MTDNQREKNLQKLARLRAVMQAKGYVEGIDLANAINYSQGYISEILNEKKGVPKTMGQKLEDSLNVNRKWFEGGIGEMFLHIVEKTPLISNENTLADANNKNDKSATNTHPRLEAEPLYIAADPNDYNNDGSKYEDLGNGMLRFRFPIIPIKAQAGYLRGFQDPEYYDGFKTEYLEVYKEYHGHYLAFEVKGDSMTPTDPSLFPYMALPGWIAVGREVVRTHWQYKLHTHNTDSWIIIHKTKGILIKSIVKHDVDNGIITIHSLNPEYEDEDLHLEDVAQIFAVQKYIVNAR